MTITYTTKELKQRADIFDTHSLLVNFLTMDVMHNLVHLFDETCCNGAHFLHKTIVGFIEKERKERGLDATHVTITSKAEKKSNANSILLLDILKNGKSFVHLSIHLVSKERNPEKYGMIHIKKDIYFVKRSCRDKDEYCALLRVDQPNTNSLHFTIGFDDDTNTSPLASVYDNEVNEEMDVIVSVLNKMFDATDDSHFVGNSEMRLHLPIQNKTNVLLKNMNNHPQVAVRRNRGKLMNINHSQHLNNAYFKQVVRRHATKKNTHQHKTRKSSRTPIATLH